MNRLLTSVLLMFISLLIGCCQAGVDQPPDVPDALITPPIIEQNQEETPDVSNYNNNNNNPPKNPPSRPRDSGSCDSHVIIGMPGPIGPMGPQGIPGVQGPAGFPGNPGNNGNNGPAGPSGRSGERGHKGERGMSGIPGSPGGPGFTGPMGPNGAPGERGSPGAPGKQGIVGPRGNVGPTGPAGPIGYPGGEGPRGLKGEPGICECPQPDQTTSDRPARRSRPAKSAFSAARTTSLLATNGPVVVTFQEIFTNVGENFDKETGKFLCAVAGTYYFSMNVYKSSAQNFPLVQLLLNGDHKVAVIDYGTSDTEDAASNSVILELEVGDEVYLQLYDGREIHSSHYKFTTFSGFLISEA